VALPIAPFVTRSEFYAYLFTLYRITPKAAPSMQAFSLLVVEHREGRPVQRELLAAAAPILGGLAKRYQRPGDLVSDFWEMTDHHLTLKDIAAGIRTKLRNELEKTGRRTTRDTDYQKVELGESAALRELLPGWFFELPQTTQEYLWSSVIEEESSEERAERLQTNPGTERSNKSRLFAELRKKLATKIQSTGPLGHEPRANPKPNARGSKKTK